MCANFRDFRAKSVWVVSKNMFTKFGLVVALEGAQLTDPCWWHECLSIYPWIIIKRFLQEMCEKYRLDIITFRFGGHLEKMTAILDFWVARLKKSKSDPQRWFVPIFTLVSPSERFSQNIAVICCTIAEKKSCTVCGCFVVVSLGFVWDKLSGRAHTQKTRPSDRNTCKKGSPLP